MKEVYSPNKKNLAAFKIPSLRNLKYTAPYMHNGRFQTLEQVLEFYSDSVHKTPFTDPKFPFTHQHGSKTTLNERKAIIAFLNTLNDSNFTK